MPGKMALVNYIKRHPEKFDSDICAAVLAWSHKLFKQEAPYEISMPALLFAMVAVTMSRPIPEGN